MYLIGTQKWVTEVSKSEPDIPHLNKRRHMSMFQGMLLPITSDLVLTQRYYPLVISINFLKLSSVLLHLAMTDTMINSTDNAQPCVPRTHTSPAIIQLLKNLLLPNILQRNKKIEAENDARSANTLNHALDPVGHPQPGSEVASLITIDAEDLT